MTKKTDKKSSTVTPISSSWMDIDRSIDNLRKEMERAFTSFPSIHMPKMNNSSCDVIDEGKQFRVKMDIPGIKKNEIKLDVTENSLQISGEHKEVSEDKKQNYLRRERSQISIHRTLPLSENIVTSKVTAKLSDGVLEILLPKSSPTKIQQRKSISVQ